MGFGEQQKVFLINTTLIHYYVFTHTSLVAIMLLPYNAISNFRYAQLVTYQVLQVGGNHLYDTQCHIAVVTNWLAASNVFEFSQPWF